MSLPEMMLSISLCMPLVLGSINLLCQSVSEQRLAHQMLLMEQDAQLALNIIANAVQLAGHRDPLITDHRFSEPRLRGMDDATLAARTDIHDGKSGPGLFGSDVLIIHFLGDHATTNAPLNCAGMPVPAGSVAAGNKSIDDQGYSVFYVARGRDGEPELRCKYRTASGWDSESLVQGVESFQVLYGIDRDGDGQPEHYLRASAISDEIGSTSSAVSLWEKIVAVKISLLMRSTQSVPHPLTAMTWNLFGDDYAAHHALNDRGTVLSDRDFTAEQRNRLRRPYEQLIFVRNPSRLSGPP